jgi:kynureninase
MVPSFKSHFGRFLALQGEKLHFAAHSHHFWPDVTLEAHQQVWLDAAQHVDEKWDFIFSVLIPKVQQQVARELGLSNPKTLVFAPNTHELVLRILSCLPANPHIVMSDAEFHTLERQTRRLEEAGQAQVTRVPSMPFETFETRLAAAAAGADVVFVSQVFFNSGHALDVKALVSQLPAKPLVVIDGYHGFCAVETDLSQVEQRAFYMAGGYKYAMAGEGACFLHVPLSAPQRPINTGWFAGFGNLQEKIGNEVLYAKDGHRFFGATFDASGLYRLRASLNWREFHSVSTTLTRTRAQQLQQQLMQSVARTWLAETSLIETPRRGLFLTFQAEQAQNLCDEFKKQSIAVDARGDRLRIGFGLYTDESDVEKLVTRIAK